MATRSETDAIREFILDNVSEFEFRIAAKTAERFGISRQAVNAHLRVLLARGLLVATGATRGRSYRLKPLRSVEKWYDCSGLEEHVPWDNDVRPLLEGIPENVLEMCNYGFTEILNNAIDHSASATVRIECEYTARNVLLCIDDFGVGIFKKIQSTFGLPNEFEAVKQLAKGKLTTDSSKHTGEGIYFTSRGFDQFSMLSSDIYFSHAPSGDWLIDGRACKSPGTLVRMTIGINSQVTLDGLFGKFTAEDDLGHHFSKTHYPVRLAEYGEGNLVSRSQAKRVLARLDLFQEVLLDFQGVTVVGQAFADEIFRVYQWSHPEIKIFAINTNENVLSMITRARSHLPPPKGLGPPQK